MNAQLASLDGYEVEEWTIEPIELVGMDPSVEQADEDERD